MHENSIAPRIERSLYGLLVLFCCTLLGCAVVGSVVPVEKRIALSETKNIQETFQADGLRVEYSYTVSDGILSLKCSASVRFHMKSFDVRLLFLDAQGTVLQQKVVYSSTRGSINERLDIPEGAAGISFTYSGQPYRGHA